MLSFNHMCVQNSNRSVGLSLTTAKCKRVNAKLHHPFRQGTCYWVRVGFGLNEGSISRRRRSFRFVVFARTISRKEKRRQLPLNRIDSESAMDINVKSMKFKSNYVFWGRQLLAGMIYYGGRGCELCRSCLMVWLNLNSAEINSRCWIFFFN